MKPLARTKNTVALLAAARIERLFELAQTEFKTNPVRSNEWVALALRIAKRNRARISTELKTRYCKYCHAFLVEKKSKRTQKENGFVSIHCLNCDKKFLRKSV